MALLLIVSFQFPFGSYLPEWLWATLGDRLKWIKEPTLCTSFYENMEPLLFPRDYACWKMQIYFIWIHKCPSLNKSISGKLLFPYEWFSNTCRLLYWKVTILSLMTSYSANIKVIMWHWMKYWLVWVYISIIKRFCIKSALQWMGQKFCKVFFFTHSLLGEYNSLISIQWILLKTSQINAPRVETLSPLPDKHLKEIRCLE